MLAFTFSVGFAATSGAAQADSSHEIANTGGGNGHLYQYEYAKATSPGGVNYSYLLYTPAGWTPDVHWPLYMNLHGCGESAAEMMVSSQLNVLADSEHFVVAYPDNQGDIGGCWRSVTNDYVGPISGNADVTRGANGQADIVAGMTKQIISNYGIDTERVYMAGGSSGAFQTSGTAAAYPELYAAVGNIAGPGPGMAATCAVYPDLVVPLYAQSAVRQMGSRAHVMPFITFGGTNDPLGELNLIVAGGCSRLAAKEWLAINNILKPKQFAVDPTVVNGQVPNGYKWKKITSKATNGCVIGEEWVINGMGHAWPGGSTDPAYDGIFNDSKGPDASRLTWEFFKQFTLSGGNVTCGAGGGAADGVEAGDSGSQVPTGAVVTTPKKVPAKWILKWPTKSGKAKVGKKVKVTVPKLSALAKGHKVTKTYRWTVAGKRVGATGRTIKLKKAFRNKAVKVTLTIKAPGFTPRAKTISFGKVK